MTTSKTYLWQGTALLLTLCAPLIFSGCNGDDGEGPGASGADVNLSQHSSLGPILVDADGMTLYYFTRDADGSSACTTQDCLTAWPVFYAEDIDVGEGLDAADFGEIDRGGGEMQTTYMGWPLYYYAPDQNPGDVAGENVNNVWFVAKPDYSVMIASQPVEDGGAEVHYLTDAEGATLYLFENDMNGVSNCSGACLENWPVFYDEDLTAPSNVSESDFGSIDRGGGVMQTTYKGWPLYYYADDNARGDVNGQGRNDVWFVVPPSVDEAPEGENPTAETGVGIAEDEAFGEYLVDQDGMTLYYFTPDADGTSACTEGCLAVWPVFYGEDPDIGEGLDAADFGSIDRGGGEMQTTYKGWPLYYYASDNEPGDINGEEVANWLVAKPGYTVMISRQAVGGGAQIDYLVDAEGNTLYLFQNDASGTSNCTDGCLSNWPAFYSENISVPSPLSAADFGSIDRGGGEMQTTYKGWPLYYYVGDNARGETNGHGLPNWVVMETDEEPAPEE